MTTQKLDKVQNSKGVPGPLRGQLAEREAQPKACFMTISWKEWKEYSLVIMIFPQFKLKLTQEIRLFYMVVMNKHLEPQSPRDPTNTDHGEKSNTYSGEGSLRTQCNQCDYTSSQASHLRTHLKTHSGEKSNKCNQCDFACSDRSNLRRHMKRHRSV